MNFFVWQRTIVDESGNVLPSASVTVTDVVTGGLVQLYSDEGSTTAGNPITADSNGFVRFYVKSGVYDIVATLGSDSRTWGDEAIGSPYKITPEEVSADVTPANYQYPPGHLYRYGTNTTPGTTNMTTAAQNAHLASLDVQYPNARVLVSGSILIRSGQHIRFDGTRFETDSTSLKVFVASEVSDFSTTGVATLTGVGAGENDSDGSLSGSAALMQISDCARFHVDTVKAVSVRGGALITQPGSSTTARSEHGIVNAVHAFGCYVGLLMEDDQGSEYITINSVYFARCDIGAEIAAGNAMILGGSNTDNRVNWHITSGFNHAHGIIANVSSNHAVEYLLHAEDVTNGQTFSSCHWYGNSASSGAIFFDESKGIILDGGHLDCHLYCYKGDNSGINIIRNMYCPGAYGLRRLAGTNNGHDELLIMDCWGAGTTAASDGLDSNGQDMNDPSMLFVSVKRAKTSTQSLSGATDLVWNTVVTDRRGAYNDSTGVTTVPASPGTGLSYLHGFYRITGNIVIAGTSLVATNSYLELKIGSTAMRPFFPGQFGTTLQMYAIDTVIELAASDAVKFTANIDGSSVTHGATSYESELTITRLSA